MSRVSNGAHYPRRQAPRVDMRGRYGEHGTNERVPDTEEERRQHPRLRRCAHPFGPSSRFTRRRLLADVGRSDSFTTRSDLPQRAPRLRRTDACRYLRPPILKTDALDDDSPDEMLCRLKGGHEHARFGQLRSPDRVADEA